MSHPSALIAVLTHHAVRLGASPSPTMRVLALTLVALGLVALVAVQLEGRLPRLGVRERRGSRARAR